MEGLIKDKRKRAVILVTNKPTDVQYASTGVEDRAGKDNRKIR